MKKSQFLQLLNDFDFLLRANNYVKIIMKNLRLTFLFFIFQMSFTAQGQAGYTVGFAANHINFAGFGSKSDWQYTWFPAKLTIGIPLTEKLSAYPALALGKASYGDTPKDRFFRSIDLDLKYNFTQTALQPYALLGYSIAHAQTSSSREFYGGPNVGLGINFWFQYNFGLNLQETYTLLPGYHNYHQLSLGVMFRIPKGRTDCDKDGFLDTVDACPTVAGTAKGCPDRDGDGVADKDDLCPDVAGAESAKGCPDKDGDGVKDDKDQCPEEAGKKELNGCPDKDGDGIADSKDECPDEAGGAETKGCPDKDGDHVPDKDDACPALAGKTELKGCPDRDNDGVSDDSDNCPDEAGLTANKGCPAVKKEEVKRVEKELNMHAVRIQFETSKDNLRPSSFPSLDQVVALMNEFPYSKFLVEGHTDSTGTSVYNLNIDLSQRRADVIKYYFVSKGIAEERISTKGYGSARPLASNKTSAGRAKNRRSEIHLNND